MLSLLLAVTPVYGTKADELSLTAMHNFGACVVRTTPAGADEVLAMDYRTDAYRDRLNRIAKGHSRCTRPGTELKFNGVLFAGAMAEALLESKSGSLPAADRLKLPLSARSPVESMALCTVVTSPTEVAELLRTEVATDQEKTAADALTRTLNACLSGADKAELNRPALRSVLALAAWRIASEAEKQSNAEGNQ